MSNFIQSSLLSFLMVLLGIPLQGSPVKIGLGKVDISPPVGSPMAGYGARKGVVESVHDPLYAKAMLMESDDQRIALITFDLRRMASPRLIREIKAMGYDQVLLTSSHTHSGPNADLFDFPSKDQSYRLQMEDKVLAMVREARKTLFSAYIGVSGGTVYLGHNRRLVKENGEVIMRWRNEERKPTHPVDPTLTTIRIEDFDGNTRALMVHYACHPVVLGPDNLAVSADFPGAMRRAVNEKLGDEVEVFFLQGAAGDINPFEDKQPLDQDGFAVMEKVGQKLATAVLELNQGLNGKTEPFKRLQVREKELEFEHRWFKNKTVGIHLTTILMNEQLAFAGFPGEVFVALQMNLSDRSPINHTLMLGYTISGMHEWPDYIPTRQAAVEGGYGAGYRTHIEVGAGEIMVDQAIISLYKMLGKLDFDKNGF